MPALHPLRGLVGHDGLEGLARGEAPGGGSLPQEEDAARELVGLVARPGRLRRVEPSSVASHPIGRGRHLRRILPSPGESSSIPPPYGPKRVRDLLFQSPSLRAHRPTLTKNAAAAHQRLTSVVSGFNAYCC